MWWRDLGARRVVLQVRRERKVPAREALVEEAQERLAALAEDPDADRVDVGDDLRAKKARRRGQSSRLGALEGAKEDGEKRKLDARG